MNTTDATMHGKFIWCELMTSDVVAAGNFYRSVVGWQTSELSMPNMPSYFLFEIGEGEHCPGIGGMMAFPPELEGQMPPNWTGYVAVDDVDLTARQVVELGGRVQRAPSDIPGVGRFAVIADPQGAVICIMTPLPPQSPPPVAAAGAPGTIGWYELVTRDAQAGLDFYSAIFGWTHETDMDLGPAGLYRIFARNGQAIGGMMSGRDIADRPCWRYYFIVETMGPALDRIRNGGGEVAHGPMPVPGESWVAHARDPQGAFFAITSPKM